jgi:uncharacterized protein (DUF427 family)
MTHLEDRRLPAADRSSAWRSAEVAVLPCPRRIRAVAAGETVADSTRALYLFEHDHLPVYYFPVEDVRTDLFEPSERRTTCERKGEAAYWTMRVGDRALEDVMWGYDEPLETIPEIAGHRAFYWGRMDHWYEEDDEVFVHPRSPYHRVDVLSSSRHVRVVVAGETVAETRRPRLLFETGLPTRYYIPKADVRMDLLELTATVTQCPYKGKASYWSARVRDAVVEDIAWSYPFPIPECPKIEQLVAFYNERVEALYVDGELQPVPQTPWSKRPR